MRPVLAGRCLTINALGIPMQAASIRLAGGHFHPAAPARAARLLPHVRPLRSCCRKRAHDAARRLPARRRGSCLRGCAAADRALRCRHSRRARRAVRRVRHAIRNPEGLSGRSERAHNARRQLPLTRRSRSRRERATAADRAGASGAPPAGSPSS